jgi:hypothetical protein
MIAPSNCNVDKMVKKPDKEKKTLAAPKSSGENILDKIGVVNTTTT